jgi:hypothetical protein
MIRVLLSFLVIFLIALAALLSYSMLAKMPRNTKIKLIISVIVAIIGTVIIFLLEVN